MKTYIAILRGINVGGHRKIKMDDLKKLFVELNCTKISTYIQSGNIIFQTEQSNKQELETLIKDRIQKNYGFDVPVIVKDLEEFSAIIEQNPFIQDKTKDPDYFHLTFLSDSPKREDINNLLKQALPQEDYTIGNKSVYLYCPNGYSKSKLSNNYLENKLNVTATTRNWKTTIELLNIAKSKI